MNLYLDIIILVSLGVVVHILCDIDRKVDDLMAKEADLQVAMDTLKADAGALVTLVTNQTAQIAALSAQIAAGSPVTQDQLDALTAEAQDVVSSLSPLVTPPPPTP